MSSGGQKKPWRKQSGITVRADRSYIRAGRLCLVLSAGPWCISGSVCCHLIFLSRSIFRVTLAFENRIIHNGLILLQIYGFWQKWQNVQASICTETAKCLMADLYRNGKMFIHKMTLSEGWLILKGVVEENDRKGSAT